MVNYTKSWLFMAINVDQDESLAVMQNDLLKIRTVIKGAPFVKALGVELLPSPNEVDKTSAQALSQYAKYNAGAEFDEYTGQTLTSMIGKLNLDDFTPELEPALSYLINDVDGDGCTLKGLTESLASNVLAVNWHISAVDYQGLQGVAIEDVSVAEAEKLNPRATIKQYARESVVKAHFATINGRKQLAFIMLKEVGETFDKESYQKESIESYLMLALDEAGNYYQQKVVKGGKDGALQEGEKDYVTFKDGSSLKFIPLEIVSDKEINHQLPQKLGFLNPIGDKCLFAYNVSADHKEALLKFVSTEYITGATQADIDGFPDANGGRNYIQRGKVNFLLGEMKVEVIAADGSLVDFRQYKEDNKNEIRSLGGVVPEYSTGDTSATEAMINSSEQNSVLNPLVSGIEKSVKKLIAYCAMFEGLVSQENVNEYASTVMFDMPRDFAKVIPSVDAGRFVIEMVNSRLMTEEQATKKLISQGWHEGEVEQIMQELDEMPPPITLENEIPSNEDNDQD